MDIIDKILSGVHNLPTLPTIYTAIFEAMEDPNITSEKLAKIISADQVTALKLLKVANSPFYGFYGRIDTISQAVLYLGFNEVRNIVLALSVINFFSKNKIILHFRPVDFWAHSIGVGIATRLVGAAIGEKKLENYFLGGIFHDIGKLLFFELAHKEYVKALEIVENNNIRIKDAEVEVFGIDHARVGQILAEKWKLPLSIQNVIFYHHKGIIEDKQDLLIASVHIGDILARIMEFGYAGDNLIPEPNPEIWSFLKVPPGTFSSMQNPLKENFESTVRLMLVE